MQVAGRARVKTRKNGWEQRLSLVPFLGRWGWQLLPAWGIALLLANFQITLALLLGGMADLALLLIALILVSGGATGFVLGRAQLQSMRNHLRWDVEGWTRWSIIAGVAGSAVLILPTVLTGQLLDREFLALALPLYFFGLSAAQALLLQADTISAWLWPLANTSAAVISSALLLRNPLYLHASDYLPRLTLGLGAGFLAYVLVCGAMLFWLHEQRHNTQNIA